MDRLPDNVPGSWFVDSSCVPCGACLQFPDAERLLSWNPQHSWVRFHAQPVSCEDLALALQLQAVCPALAICCTPEDSPRHGRSPS